MLFAFRRDSLFPLLSLLGPSFPIRTLLPTSVFPSLFYHLTHSLLTPFVGRLAPAYKEDPPAGFLYFPEKAWWPTSTVTTPTGPSSFNVVMPLRYTQ